MHTIEIKSGLEHVVGRVYAQNFTYIHTTYIILCLDFVALSTFSPLS